MGSDSSVPAATTSPAAATTGADSVIGPDRSSPVELDRRDLLIPVQGVTAEHLTGSQFDDKRGGARKHEALDILAPRNTPVLAVENGTIARLFLSKAGGITVYQFDPTGSYAYYYAHLERYADGLREGQQVRRGQTLGYVGTSGNAPKDTPHLHFAIFRLTEEKRWWEGTPIDPYEVLR
jgi:murein DD-endopeptidase MepM/ murein hydrolase activator NlpD